jgi:hypothetical protein
MALSSLSRGSGSVFALWGQKGNCPSGVILRHRPPWDHYLLISISGSAPPEQSSEQLLTGADSHGWRVGWGAVGGGQVWYIWEPIHLGSSWLISDDYHPITRHLLGMLREGKSLSSACSSLLMGLMHVLQTCGNGEQISSGMPSVCSLSKPT